MLYLAWAPECQLKTENVQSASEAEILPNYVYNQWLTSLSCEQANFYFLQCGVRGAKRFLPEFAFPRV